MQSTSCNVATCAYRPMSAFRPTILPRSSAMARPWLGWRCKSAAERGTARPLPSTSWDIPIVRLISASRPSSRRYAARACWRRPRKGLQRASKCCECCVSGRAHLAAHACRTLPSGYETTCNLHEDVSLWWRFALASMPGMISWHRWMLPWVG